MLPVNKSAAQPTTDPPSVYATLLAAGELERGARVTAAGPLTVECRRLLIPPGAELPWHVHDGTVIVVIARGVISRFSAIHANGVRTYSAGEAMCEQPGEVHRGRNDGTEEVELWATYLTPPGAPLSRPVPPPPWSDG